MKILITAGPTREAIDPVRFLSNRSTGKMGYALAQAAHELGHAVTLVSGPVALTPPGGVTVVAVESASEMAEAVKMHAPSADLVIMAAAVADYRPKVRSAVKIKKGSGGLVLELERTEDILDTLGRSKRPGQTLVGFAAETDHVRKNAEDKLKMKNLDMIVANDVTLPGAGFNTDTNIAALITKSGTEEQPMQTKRQLAEVILDRILAMRA